MTQFDEPEPFRGSSHQLAVVRRADALTARPSQTDSYTDESPLRLAADAGYGLGLLTGLKTAVALLFAGGFRNFRHALDVVVWRDERHIDNSRTGVRIGVATPGGIRRQGLGVAMLPVGTDLKDVPDTDSIDYRVVAALGERIFAELAPSFEARNESEFVAINVRTKAFVIADTRAEALDAFASKFGDAPAYLRRIGELDHAGSLYA